MWLKLGEGELVNLDKCSGIRKEEDKSISLCYTDPSQNRVIHFEEEESRDMAFDRLVENLVRLQKAME